MCISMLEKLPDETEVYVAEPFDNKIISEWRCYIRYSTIEDSKNYSGNFRITPNYNWIEKQIPRNYPTCYTMDVGVLENGENVIIEYNDMWAIGNYGMDNINYYSMLRERYFEIIRYA
jgi:hypothetical protein